MDPLQDSENSAPAPSWDSEHSQASAHTATQEDIARLAYSLWESRGGVEGSPEEDWLQAERLIASRVSD